MKPLKIIITLFSSVFLLSCGVPQTAERKPVPPSGSVEGDMPWNTPQEGEGGGMLGGMLQGR